MLRDITIGQHFPGESLVHRFDPRLKLVMTVLYIVLLFAASNPLGLTLSILFLVGMYATAKDPVQADPAQPETHLPHHRVYCGAEPVFCHR